MGKLLTAELEVLEEVAFCWERLKKQSDLLNMSF
jgi:hypothetical protein